MLQAGCTARVMVGSYERRLGMGGDLGRQSVGVQGSLGRPMMLEGSWAGWQAAGTRGSPPFTGGLH